MLVVAAAFVESLWPLTWVALVPLFLALRGASSSGQAFLLGWWTETLIIWMAFYWLVGTMGRYGFIPVPMSLLLFAIIGIGNGVRLGVFTWWIRRLWTAPNPWWYRLVLPACTYVAVDYLTPRVFPWFLGMTQFRASPLIQVADVTGIHGITFLLVMGSTVGATLFPHVTRPTAACRRLMLLVFVALFVVNGGYGVWRLQQVRSAMQQAPTLRLAILQPNIGIYEKGRREEQATHLRLQVDMSRTTLPQQPDIIIWPETMYPSSVPTHADRLTLPSLPGAEATHWLIGALTYRRRGFERQVFNSVLLVAPDTRILARYDKQRLLAFGEYIPLQRWLPFLRHISPTIGNLTPGSGGLAIMPNGVAIGPLICYEDIFPALGRRAVRAGAHLLVNLTNDAWFGQTRAPSMHRMLAAFRAIENRVYLVRVTNTGLTSIIDAAGREQGALPLFQRGTLVRPVHLPRLSTLYTRFGDWFAQTCSLAALLLPCRQWLRRRQP